MNVEERTRSNKKKIKKKRSWFKVFVISFLVVLVGGGATFAYVAYKTFQTANDAMSI